MEPPGLVSVREEDGGEFRARYIENSGLANWFPSSNACQKGIAPSTVFAGDCGVKPMMPEILNGAGITLLIARVTVPRGKIQFAKENENSTNVLNV